MYYTCSNVHCCVQGTDSVGSAAASCFLALAQFPDIQVGFRCRTNSFQCNLIVKESSGDMYNIDSI